MRRTPTLCDTTRRRCRVTWLCVMGLFGLLPLTPIQAQGRKADYQRAANLAAMTRNKVFRARVQPNWFADNTKFWYRVDTGPDAYEFVVVDALKGQRQLAFDHARLAAALSKTLHRKVEASRLPIGRLQFNEDPQSIVLIGVRGGQSEPRRAWHLDLRTYELTPVEAGDVEEESLTSAPAPYPSRRTGQETTITFVNQTNDTLQVFWVDPEGNRRPYGTLAPGESREQHTFGGHVWLIIGSRGGIVGVYEATDEPGTAIIRGQEARRRNVPPRRAEQARAGGLSPDGLKRAILRDHNVWLSDPADAEPVPLTTDGRPDDAYTAIYWSPDSSRLVAVQTIPAQERKVTIVESSPPDQLQPKVRVIDYLKPGDRVAHPRPRLFDVSTRQRIPISEELFPNPWSITGIRWEPDSSRFTFLYNERGHQVLRVIAVDARTGEAREIVEERSATFIDYAGKHFLHYLPETAEIIWMSERDGWNHLYLYDAITGQVKNQITKGSWVVRGVDRVDAQRRQIWLRLSGYYPDQDPYHVHYARIGFDGQGLTLLTEGDGTHTLTYSPDGRYFLDTWSRVDMPPVTELRRTEDGRLVCVLERADASALLKTGWKMPERFHAKGRDGVTDIYGVIYRPTNFSPSRKYPVIEAIYAGPQSSYVPKAWSSFHGPQELAELGFIVVQIDGMGTSNRSKAFHDVCWKNLADAGFPDRILWLKAAARTRPWMDLTRVGIYGGSAGGQNALGGLLFHPDFYKVGVADCGCHDNRMDKIWWNELWMGWPVGPHYAEQSNVTNAHRLQGKLLLMVGEVDTNVDPASTMQVVNALIKADKDFELLVMPGVGHGTMGTPYGKRRMQDFFVRHLLGVEPRSR